MPDCLQTASSPEEVGIPSSAILRFLDRIEKERIAMHGFVVIRHGKVAVEGYWPPFSAQRFHRMYSVSKSMVSLAVGLMIDEGRLSLGDRVAAFFPDKLPDKVHPYIEQATVRDLLMMATPHSENAYTRYDRDWVKTFFHKEPSHPPGTIFAYDTAATVVLTAIVERLSGMPFLEYMRPRLLDPIGFSPGAWCIKTPEGGSWGGSGVLCTLRDMASIALVCLNGGSWYGKQLISQEYVCAARSRQIDNSQHHGEQGYGYQIWRTRHNGFAFLGMGSQLAICLPDEDFVFACISDTQGQGALGVGIYDALWQELYPALSGACLQEQPQDAARLRDRLASLAFAPPVGEQASPVAGMCSGKWYAMNPNPMGITQTRFTFEGSRGVWEYENAQGRKRLAFGIGTYAAGKFPQEGYFGEQIGVASPELYDCLASGAWAQENKLNLIVYITDIYLGTLRVTVTFKGDEIALWMTKVAEWFLDEYEGFAGGYIR